MRFMMIVIPKDYATASPDTMPDPAAVEKMMVYNQELLDSGIVIGMESLYQPSVDGARVSFESGSPVVTDGPFTEAKEVIGGYWMLDVPSKDEAVAWAKKAPMPAGRRSRSAVCTRWRSSRRTCKRRRRASTTSGGRRAAEPDR